MNAARSSDQLRAARALLGLEQGSVARDAGIQFISQGIQLRRHGSVAAGDHARRLDEILALANAMPVIDPSATEESLYGDDGLPR